MLGVNHLVLSLIKLNVCQVLFVLYIVHPCFVVIIIKSFAFFSVPIYVQKYCFSKKLFLNVLLLLSLHYIIKYMLHLIIYMPC